MDTIGNVGAGGAGVQHLPGVRIAYRPEWGDASVQLRATSHIPGMF